MFDEWFKIALWVGYFTHPPLGRQLLQYQRSCHPNLPAVRGQAVKDPGLHIILNTCENVQRRQVGACYKYQRSRNPYASQRAVGAAPRSTSSRGPETAEAQTPYPPASSVRSAAARYHSKWSARSDMQRQTLGGHGPSYTDMQLKGLPKLQVSSKHLSLL